jgi:hypothetical protein
MCLTGLTLLECGVPASDDLLKRTAKVARTAAPRLTHTYTVAVALLFLDRLHDDNDNDQVRSLALRLMAGQKATGAWSYYCPLLTTAESQALSDFVQSQGGGPKPPERPTNLPGRVGRFPVVLGPDKLKPHSGNLADGDNSNSQFAVLALWVAQRRDIHVRPSLVLVERYFRQTQLNDGGWSYYVRDGRFCGSMTCAGLLTLAVGRSVSLKDFDGRGPEKDPAIEKGFRYLDRFIGADSVHSPGDGGSIIQATAWGDLYYLWSLERVAVVYDLKTIGGKDWYAWASKVIVEAQKDDGSWRDVFVGPADTCFALLVLKRVNVVQDLTMTVKKVISVKDLEGARR